MALKMSGAPLPRARNVTPSAQTAVKENVLISQIQCRSKTDINKEKNRISERRRLLGWTMDVDKGYSHIVGEVERGGDGGEVGTKAGQVEW